MADDATLTRDVHAAFERDSTINMHKNSIAIDVRDAIAILSGEVSDISIKRLAPLQAAAVDGVKGVLDRLRVTPGESRGDGKIIDDILKTFLDESVFKSYAIHTDGEGKLGRQSDSDDGIERDIRINVDDGRISLTGKAESLTHKRLADVLAWWTPGVADVDNQIHVVPPERDNDDEITDAVRMVLEEDPALDASQIAVHTADRAVTLDGFVHNAENRRQAELDAWYVLGVHKVVNRIEVRA